MSDAIKTLRKYPVLGFDTETRPVFRKGVQHDVSLLQLSTSKEAFLFRLNHLGLPNELVALLEDSSILKVGIAILDDVRGLQKLRNFKADGFIELADIAGDLGIVTCGLRNLAAIFLGVRISGNEASASEHTSHLLPEFFIRGRETYSVLLDQPLSKTGQTAFSPALSDHS